MIGTILFRHSRTKVSALLLLLCLSAVTLVAPRTASLSSSGATRSFGFSQGQPSVTFTGLRHYGRVEGTAVVPVTASDDVGVSRVELYVEGQLISAVDIVPNLPLVVVPFVWNTLTVANGKHILIAKAFDAAGNSETKAIILTARNFSSPTPTPTPTPSPSPTPTPPTGNNITINPSVTYQTMSGWEATSQAGQLEAVSWNVYRNSLLDQAANDLGVNRIRVELVSSVENPTDYYAQWRAGQITTSQYLAKRYEIVNDNADPNVVNVGGFKWSSLNEVFDDLVIPLRQRLQARGETLWVSICYVDFGPSTFEHKTNPAEYGELVRAAYNHIQTRYGFPPDSWEVILEPDTTAAAWSSVQVAQAINAAGQRLTAGGFSPRFIAPSTTSAANTPGYIDQIAQTPGAMQYVTEFSYHRYCCASDEILQMIANRAVQHNKQVGMLEWIGADYNTLHQDIKLARASSWQQYTLAFPGVPDNGAQYYLINESNPSNPVITLGSRTKILRQYFKFIRSGARRIQAMTGNASFDPLAFMNPDGKYVVVVKASSSGTFNVHNLPAGTYGIKYSTGTQYDVNSADVSIGSGQSVPATIPASGVITIYRR
ncbi:MAG TPA: glycoside hydrolase family 30 beta sandwich domain-containing protein [Pyrinomonadaceae bacterium]